MWVRKSETEIQEILAQREADKKNLIRPVLFAAAITIVVMSLYSLGFRGSTQRFIVQPAEDLNWRLIVAGLLVFTIIAGVAIHRQRQRGHILGGDDAILRCRDCKELDHANPSKSCAACGGKQEPSKFFYWSEESDSSSTHS